MNVLNRLQPRVNISWRHCWTTSKQEKRKGVSSPLRCDAPVPEASSLLSIWCFFHQFEDNKTVWFQFKTHSILTHPPIEKTPSCLLIGCVNVFIYVHGFTILICGWWKKTKKTTTNKYI